MTCRYLLTCGIWCFGVWPCVWAFVLCALLLLFIARTGLEIFYLGSQEMKGDPAFCLPTSFASCNIWLGLGGGPMLNELLTDEIFFFVELTWNGALHWSVLRCCFTGPAIRCCPWKEKQNLFAKILSGG